MTKDDIEKTRKGYLVDLRGHKNLLLSFGGIHQGLQMPVFEFFNSISDIDCDKIFLRDFHQAWYQKGVDSELNHIDKLIEHLREQIAINQYDKICFLGNSMGGYAAILFGTLLNVDSVISFAPQTFIDRLNRWRSWDRRWTKELSSVYAFKEKRPEYFDLKNQLSTLDSYKTQINIYYSKNDRLDRYHAERLKSTRNILLHPRPEEGHDIVKQIRNSGELKALLQSAFQSN